MSSGVDRSFLFTTVKCPTSALPVGRLPSRSLDTLCENSRTSIQRTLGPRGTVDSSNRLCYESTPGAWLRSRGPARRPQAEGRTRRFAHPRTRRSR